MDTYPQPPRPPAPPQAPGSGSNFAVIALLILALIVVMGGMAVWLGLRVLSSAVHVNVADGANKEVSIKTPLGSLEVNHELNEASLGLPIYPGATRLTEHDSVNLNFDIGDQANFRVLAGKFETPDSLEKVRAFYHDHLGDQITKFRDKDEEGDTVFEIKEGKLEKAVKLKANGDKTVIELVRISQAGAEAN